MSTDTYSEIGNPRPWITKDPDAVLDYSFDWTDWLNAGELIDSHVVTVDGVTKDSDTRSGAIVTAWVSGGAAIVGQMASVTCKITTNSVPARTEQRTVYLRIRER